MMEPEIGNTAVLFSVSRAKKAQQGYWKTQGAERSGGSQKRKI